MVQMLLCVVLLLLAGGEFCHGETIEVINDNYWQHGGLRFETMVVLPVSPSIPHPVKAEFVIKFNEPVLGIEQWKADILRMEEDDKNVVLKYKYGGGLPEGDFEFKIQVICTDDEGSCPTQMEVCFLTPEDQANLCSGEGESSVTDPPVTDPPVTDPLVIDPAVTDPAVTDTPITDPPVTEPPVTDPSATDSPVDDGDVLGTNDEITVYGGSPGGGNCGYQGWPEYAEDNFVALPHLIYDTGKGCGMCVKMSYEGRETIVYATDRCPECGGDSGSDVRHWDLAMTPFQYLTQDTTGHIAGITTQILSQCPSSVITGNMEIFINEDNGYYMKIQPIKACARVTEMHILKDGNVIELDLPNNDYYFTFGPAASHGAYKPLNTPFTVRTTSEHGTVVDVEITSRPGTTVGSNNNCPEDRKREFESRAMPDIEVINDNYWLDGRKMKFETMVNLPVSPSIPHPIRAEFKIKFNKKVTGIENWKADVVEISENGKEVVLKYKYDGGLPEGDFEFKIQVICKWRRSKSCPTKMDVCFLTPDDQANLCEGPPATDAPATDPPATDPPATDPPATDPPATDPPATDPPATDPPATNPPATDSPATDPPATDPPATDPPVTDGPVTEPPVDEEIRELHSRAMTDIVVIGNSFWGSPLRFQTEVKLHVSPTIPYDAEKPEILLKFNKKVKNLEVYQLDILRWENGKRNAVLKYKYGGLNEGDFKFSFQVICRGNVRSCPTKIDACFLNPENQEHSCSNGGGVNSPVTNPPVTEPPVTEPPATNPPATNPPATNSPATNSPVTEDGDVWTNDEITVYGGSPGGGNCGFQGWPEYAEDNFVALPHLIYDTGKGCGMCVKMSYEGRETIVYATDRCPECGGDRDSDARHWDLAMTPFQYLTQDTTGHIGGISTQILSHCPSNVVTGNMEIFINEDNGYYMKIQPIKACARVTKMDIIKDGNVIELDLPNNDYYFTFGPAASHGAYKPLNTPFTVRTTSEHGTVVDVEITSRPGTTVGTNNNCPSGDEGTGGLVTDTPAVTDSPVTDGPVTDGPATTDEVCKSISVTDNWDTSGGRRFKMVFTVDVANGEAWTGVLKTNIGISDPEVYPPITITGSSEATQWTVTGEGPQPGGGGGGQFVILATASQIPDSMELCINGQVGGDGDGSGEDGGGSSGGDGGESGGDGDGGETDDGTDFEPTECTDETCAEVTYTLSGACDSSAATGTPYNDALHYSMCFYEAQRSGALPANNRISWRGDSALSDGSDVNVDLTGGWYDAGDYIKFNYPQAAAVTLLAWGGIEFREAYETAGEFDTLLDSIKWPLDYLLKSHTDCSSSKNTLYAQVAQGGPDHNYWGPAEDIETPGSGYPLPRPAYKIDDNNPGTDLAAETAAAFAASSILFREKDSCYADKLLAHAQKLLDFAKTARQQTYNTAVHDATTFYKSWGYDDELPWAEIWLHRAKKGDSWPAGVQEVGYAYDGFSWDNKQGGIAALQCILKNSCDVLKSFVSAWESKSGPDTLKWHQQWAPNRYAANAAFLGMIGAKKTGESSYTNFAKNQIDFMLGENSAGRSYVVGMNGFGSNYVLQPHHRGSSCFVDQDRCFKTKGDGAANPNILFGALVGGPDQSGNFKDDRADYIQSEVAVDYNAGFQSAVAGLLCDDLSSCSSSSSKKRRMLNSKRAQRSQQKRRDQMKRKALREFLARYVSNHE